MTKEITVTVIDKKYSKPIDSAEVTLKSWTDTELNNETKYTDLGGQTMFSFDFNESTRYQIFSRKSGYFYCFNIKENDKLESNIDITSTTENEIILYLTSDSLHLVDYYARRIPHYPIDTLIQLLRADKYKPDRNFVIPKLDWEDIPKLLAVANDATLIKNFPRNPISSTLLNSCYLGVISMWLIESIRITEEKGIIHPIRKFPSQIPIINQKNRSHFRNNINEISEMETAYHCYLDWWNKIKNMEKMKACKINPFENAIIEW